jgi:hypothetical protein
MKYIIFLTLIPLSLLAENPSVNVRLQDPVYDFIQQVSTKYGIEFKNLNTRPYTRKQVAAFLNRVKTRVSDGQIKLSTVEQQELDYQREEFSLDLLLFEPDIQYNEKHIYRFSDKSRSDQLIIDLGLKDSAGLSVDNKEEYNTGCLYGGIRGVMRNTLAFQSEIRISSEINSKRKFPPSDYNPVNGYPYNTFGETGMSNKKSWDMFSTGLFIENKVLTAEAGVDRMRWGPAERNALTLSGDGPPIALLKVEADFWNFHYTHTINIIKGEKYKDKYMYAHRLEWRLPLHFRLGINEVVIYGDNTEDGDLRHPGTWYNLRHFDPIYAIPFIPYFFAEHYNGDRDNVALSMDLSFTSIRNLKVYTELFLDDLISPLDFFDDYWSNKWAATIGCRYYLPLNFPDISALVEYTRVEPWVYTHFFGESHRYRHYGQSLGTATVGPNGDEVYFALCLKPSRKLRAELFARNNRKGTGGRGDSITDIYFTGIDSDKKSFLGGAVQTQRTLGLHLSYEISRLIDVRASGERDMADNPDTRLTAVLDVYW